MKIAVWTYTSHKPDSRPEWAKRAVHVLRYRAREIAQWRNRSRLDHYGYCGLDKHHLHPAAGRCHASYSLKCDRGSKGRHAAQGLRAAV